MADSKRDVRYYLNQLHQVACNAIFQRSDLARGVGDGRRNIDAECGHPTEISIDTYQEYYDRFEIAQRVVELWPEECWQVTPEVYDEEDSEEDTPFEQAIKDASKSLHGEDGYYAGNHGDPLWEAMRRADVLSGIGRFGGIFLGLRDSGDLASDPGKGIYSAGNGRLLFMRCFSEGSVKVLTRENDRNSPRHGQPTMYEIKFDDPTSSGSQFGTTVDYGAGVKVHWRRFVHIADNCKESAVYGVPRQQPVFNRLMDTRKLYGGSAEMYWKGAFPGMSLETQPGAIDMDIDDDAIKDAMEQYMEGLKRYLRLIGLSAKMLAPTVVDPTPQIMVQLQAICIKLRVPQRIFMGSERGELASSQDQKAWNKRVGGRQNGHCTPRIIVPTFNRLIYLGVLPPPKDGKYYVNWPDMTALTDAEHADIAFKTTQSLALYVEKQIETTVTPVDYMVKVLGWDEDEATQYNENASELAEETSAEDEALMEQQLKAATKLQQGNGNPPPTDGNGGVRKPAPAAGVDKLPFPPR